MYDKLSLVLCIFFGILWLRQRARQIDMAARKNEILFGVYPLILILALGEKYIFDNYVPETWWKVPLQCVLLLASFAAIGFGILRDKLASTEATGSKA